MSVRERSEARHPERISPSRLLLKLQRHKMVSNLRGQMTKMALSLSKGQAMRYQGRTMCPMPAKRP